MMTATDLRHAAVGRRLLDWRVTGGRRRARVDGWAWDLATVGDMSLTRGSLRVLWAESTPGL
jgi:hypothetical protein